ncbi:MAG: sulfatase-like hydrolase/transferase, partial [Verrucomicrobiota bacterium]
INGQPVKDACRTTEGDPGGLRADMVLENDIAFGRVMELLETLPDPRAPGTKLLDNTLVIFTSDNGPNEGAKEGPAWQAGGLRGRKASITEGGLRIPFLLYWKGRLEGGTINRTHFALTDLYATFARLLEIPLGPHDGQDSYDVLDHWRGTARGEDKRPRLKFCHLGKPFSNDAMCLREGLQKIIIGPGVNDPHIRNSHGGAVQVERYNNLAAEPLERVDQQNPENVGLVNRLSANLLRLHNQGHARPLPTPSGSRLLILDDGWHNLRNDLTGEIGYEFRLTGRKPLTVSHLGLWDDHKNDQAIRAATEPPNDGITERPTVEGPTGRGLEAPHRLVLSADGQDVAALKIQEGTPDGEFRFVACPQPITLQPGTVYRLTMTTSPDDGDLFHNPAGYDGLSPRIHEAFEVIRAVYLR